MSDLAEPAASDIAAARRILRAARGVVILTGAGLSADSGLRTFRDPDGHWKKHRPEDLATPEAFRHDPCLVWGWYDARRRAASDSVPNGAHRAIADFALRRDDVAVVTQNVDGFHTDAARLAAAKRGAAPVHAMLLELHGCLFRVRCTACGRRHEHRDPIDAHAPEALPRCSECDGLLRPDVVWFGEPLGEAIEQAFVRAEQSDVCLVVGTSAVVQPAASVATATWRAGGVIVEVNPKRTSLTPVSEVSLRTTALQSVPALLAPEHG